MRTVVLHIGAMKTGTSYIQSLLWKNRELLAERGVQSPGRAWRHQKKAAQDLLASRGNAGGDLGAWTELAQEVANARWGFGCGLDGVPVVRLAGRCRTSRSSLRSRSGTSCS